MAEFDPLPLLATLDRHGVQFVVVGAVAAISQGYPLPTEDLDVAPARDHENLERIAAALRELGADLRIGKTGDTVPFPIEADFLAEADSWTVSTRFGDLDLMFVPAGTKGYEDVRRDAAATDIGGGLTVLVASLRDVIRMKEASNRPKDQAQLPALRQTLEVIRERERAGP